MILVRPRFVIRTVSLLAATIGMAAAGGAQTTPTPFGTTVEVRRILTEVRVVDDAGRPVAGLGPADFRVRVGGRRTQVESVAWYPATAEAAAAAAAPTAKAMRPGAPSAAAPEPRLIVILFQSDINLYRIKGVVRMAPQAADFVRGLAPDDRVALLTFESHLELRSDFTLDHEALARMITTTEILDGTIAPPEASSPRLTDYLSAEEARRAATMTDAVEVVARALIPIPGAKTLVLFGWGVGRYNPGHPITTGENYNAAIGALAAARTSVFSLDITTADSHTLEIGLRQLSEDTGGIYLKTNLFPASAMEKLVRVISSYYELSIAPPPGLERPYLIEVKVKRPGARVYVRQNHATGGR